MLKRPNQGPANYLKWVGLTWRHAAGMYWDHHGYARSLARNYGDVVPFMIFTQPCFLVNHPDAIYEVLVKHADKVRKQKRNSDSIGSVMSRGLLTIEGQQWRKDRLAVQSLLRTDDILKYTSIAQKVAQEEMDTWRCGDRLNLQPALGRIMMRCLCSGLFERDPGDRSDAWFAASTELSDRQMQEVVQPFHFPDWVPLPAQRRKRRSRQCIRDAVHFLLQPNEAGEYTAFQQKLMDSWHDRPEIQAEIVMSEAMTFVLAGVHTTSSVMEWMFLEVAANQEVQQRAQQEIDSARAAEGKSLNASQFPKLPYLRQIYQETIRKHPPVWAMIAREAEEEIELSNVKVPQGSWLFIYPRIVHRDSRWFPAPERFDPERFTPDNFAKIRARAFMPFAHGPHRCIGMNLAEAMMPVILGTVLQDMSLQSDRPFREVKPKFSTVCYPDGGSWVRPSKR